MPREGAMRPTDGVYSDGEGGEGEEESCREGGEGRRPNEVRPVRALRHAYA